MKLHLSTAVAMLLALSSEATQLTPKLCRLLILDEITPEELVAVGKYKDSAYMPINMNLRSAAGEVEHQHYKWALKYTVLIDSALAKLSDYVGTVYRGANLSPAELEKYQVGEVVTEYAYTSTNKYNLHPKYAAYPESVVFEIESRTGKDIEPFPNGAYENEVLFKHGTSFIITERTDVDGRLLIKMSEVP